MLQRTIINVLGIAILGFIVLLLMFATNQAARKYKAVKTHKLEVFFILMAIVFCPAVYNYKDKVEYKFIGQYSTYGSIANKPTLVETKVYKSDYFGFSFETKDISERIEHWTPDNIPKNNKKVRSVNSNKRADSRTNTSNKEKEHPKDVPEEMTREEYEEAVKNAAKLYIQQVDEETFVYPHFEKS